MSILVKMAKTVQNRKITIPAHPPAAKVEKIVKKPIFPKRLQNVPNGIRMTLDAKRIRLDAVLSVLARFFGPIW